MFASPIAVMAPLWEALARRSEAVGPRYFRCRHELLAVSLASGYYKVTGCSQVVFLPSSLGVQNGAMGLHAALQERIPMTILSPDTISYGEDPAADPGPEWPSLLVDLVGPARNAEAVVKWTKRARTSSEMVHELRRACFIAQSTPLGPTLLDIPIDLLMGPGHAELPTWVAPAATVAAPAQIEVLADLLLAADTPLIITEHGGRSDEKREALVAVAVALSAPVFEFMMPPDHNFPRSHPLYGAGPVEAVLADTDVVLLVGCNAPWHPPQQSLRPGCAVIQDGKGIHYDHARPTGVIPQSMPLPAASASICGPSPPCSPAAPPPGRIRSRSGVITWLRSGPRESNRLIRPAPPPAILCLPLISSARCTTPCLTMRSASMKSSPRCRR